MTKQFLLLFLIVLPIGLFAQKSVVISGKVMDSGTNEPLPYANVVYKKRMLGTITNLEGQFTLSLGNVQLSDTIQIIFLGYKTKAMTIEQCLEKQNYSMEFLVNEIDEVEVKAGKFKLKLFVKEVIEKYNKNRREDAHIAVAHYREKARENDKYIMFTESIGYSVYVGTIPNATKLSNYKFFCDNSRCFSFSPEWREYGTLPYGEEKKIVAIGGGKNANTFRRIELSGMLSQKKIGKYSFKLDSSYHQNNQEILVVSFKGNSDKGSIYLNRANQHIIRINCKTNKIYSRIPLENGKAQVDIRFSYFDNTPFVSKMETSFTSGALEYTNTLTILLQKLNQFRLTKDEYWGMNAYDNSPYIDYRPEEFISWSVDVDEDFEKIEKDLLGGVKTLENYFLTNTGFWYKSGSQSSKLAKKTIDGLILNF